MSAVGILGIGCVAPLGSDWSTVWESLLTNKRPNTVMLPGPSGHPSLPAYRVPEPFDVRHPRLRRSSAISHFACAAASAALEQAGPLPEGRSALVFAASDGAVVYTRKFYEGVVESGTGSPLLFPETVYNAPASHVAAMFGIEGSVLTMVGDATAGMDALSTAVDLIHSGDAERCLVVASQEVDWITCDGYRRWGLASSGDADAAILSEGSLAMVVGAPQPGDVVIEKIHPGIPGGSPIRGRLEKAYRELAGNMKPDVVVASNVLPEKTGESVAGEVFPETRFLSPKILAGEAFAVSALLQCACAWQEIRDGRARNALVSVMDWNGSAEGAVLTASTPQG